MREKIENLEVEYQNVISNPSETENGDLAKNLEKSILQKLENI